jgi:hypothetical protein
MTDKEKMEAFEVWWRLYEKKVGKRLCIRKWMKLSGEEIDAIILHTPLYVKATPNKQFRKNPQTYLNQYCWEDEIISDDDDVNPSEDYELSPNTLKAMGL